MVGHKVNAFILNPLRTLRKILAPFAINFTH